MTQSPQRDLLQQRINEKIAEIHRMQYDFPCVIVVHDIRDWTVVYMTDNGLKNLRVTLKQLQQMGLEYHKRFFNEDESKEYVPGILNLIQQKNDDQSISYFQQVRVSPQHEWGWYLSSIKVILRHDDQPILTLSVSIAVDPEHHFSAKVDRLLQENNFLRLKASVFNSLTKREKEILALMAQGLSPAEIGSKLFISEATAATHRRNIRQKIDAKNQYDLTKFAQAFNLI